MYKEDGVDNPCDKVDLEKKPSLGDEITSKIYVLFKQVKDITIGVNTGLTNSRILTNQTEKAEAVHFHTEDRHSRVRLRSHIESSCQLRLESRFRDKTTKLLIY